MPKPTRPDGPIAALHRAIARLQDGGGSGPPARVKTEHVHAPDDALAEPDAELVEIAEADADVDLADPAPD